MIYPENFEQKIDFYKIREILDRQCLSSLGQKHVDDMCFESSHGIVQELLNQTDEFKQILLSSQAFPNSGYYDLTAELKRIQMKGSYLEPELLFDLKSSLQTINSCLSYFDTDPNNLYPVLTKLTEGLEPQEELLK